MMHTDNPLSVDSYSIRALVSRDIPDIVAIQNALGQPLTVEEFEHDLDQPGERAREFSWVAHSSGAVIGHIQLAFLPTAQEDSYHVYTFGAVRADWRRHGVGTALYQTAIHALERTVADESIRVTMIQNARDENPGQFELLERLQFRVTETVRTLELDLAQSGSLPGAQDATRASLPPGYAFRAGESGDAVALAAVYNAAFAWRTTPVLTTVESTSYELSKDRLYPDLYIVLVREDGQVVGFAEAVVEQIADTERAGNPEGRVGVVHTVAVAPDNCGRGLGRAIMEQCVDVIRQLRLTKVRLSVEDANPTPARKLYESMGFQTFGRFLRYERPI